jgi:hypothetical protein
MMKMVAKVKPSERAEVTSAILSYISIHKSRTEESMPDEKRHHISGCCWKDICAVAIIGSDKFGRQSQNASLKACLARRKNGIFE